MSHKNGHIDIKAGASRSFIFDSDNYILVDVTLDGESNASDSWVRQDQLDHFRSHIENSKDGRKNLYLECLENQNDEIILIDSNRLFLDVTDHHH